MSQPKVNLRAYPEHDLSLDRLTKFLQIFRYCEHEYMTGGEFRSALTFSSPEELEEIFEVLKIPVKNSVRWEDTIDIKIHHELGGNIGSGRIDFLLNDEIIANPQKDRVALEFEHIMGRFLPRFIDPPLDSWRCYSPKHYPDAFTPSLPKQPTINLDKYGKGSILRWARELKVMRYCAGDFNQADEFRAEAVFKNWKDIETLMKNLQKVHRVYWPDPDQLESNPSLNQWTCQWGKGMSFFFDISSGSDRRVISKKIVFSVIDPMYNVGEPTFQEAQSLDRVLIQFKHLFPEPPKRSWARGCLCPEYYPEHFS